MCQIALQPCITTVKRLTIVRPKYFLMGEVHEKRVEKIIKKPCLPTKQRSLVQYSIEMGFIGIDNRLSLSVLPNPPTSEGNTMQETKYPIKTIRGKIQCIKFHKHMTT